MLNRVADSGTGEEIEGELSKIVTRGRDGQEAGRIVGIGVGVELVKIGAPIAIGIQMGIVGIIWIEAMSRFPKVGHQIAIAIGGRIDGIGFPG